MAQPRDEAHSVLVGWQANPPAKKSALSPGTSPTPPCTKQCARPPCINARMSSKWCSTNNPFLCMNCVACSLGSAAASSRNSKRVSRHTRFWDPNPENAVTSSNGRRCFLGPPHPARTIAASNSIGQGESCVAATAAAHLSVGPLPVPPGSAATTGLVGARGAPVPSSSSKVVHFSAWGSLMPCSAQRSCLPRLLRRPCPPRVLRRSSCLALGTLGIHLSLRRT